MRGLLPGIKSRYAVDFVIANGENSAGGSGITPKTAHEILEAGVNVITSGDHLWDQKEVTSLMAEEPRFLRPFNYPVGTIGRGSGIFRQDGLPPIAVMNLQGRVFMPDLENPFTGGQAEAERLRGEAKVIFVDMHAEATSEKIAMARMLDGLASAVVRFDQSARWGRVVGSWVGTSSRPPRPGAAPRVAGNGCHARPGCRAGRAGPRAAHR